MNKVLAGLEEFCVVYIDDIVCFSETWEDHLRHLRIVLKRLADYGFTIKLVKSMFGAQEIDFVGHVVGCGKMSPREAKVATLINMKQPNNKVQLRSFLGLANYFSRYIPHYANITSSLTALLSKNVQFVWTEERNNSYNKIKECLTCSPILYIANYDKPFYLFIDASNVATGSALCQFDDVDKQYHPICYNSHKLNCAERNYSVTDREALALIIAVRTFKAYLPHKFIVFSDHEPLHFISHMSIKKSENYEVESRVGML
jgi:hypothetical protein